MNTVTKMHSARNITAALPVSVPDTVVEALQSAVLQFLSANSTPPPYWQVQNLVARAAYEFYMNEAEHAQSNAARLAGVSKLTLLNWGRLAG